MKKFIRIFLAMLLVLSLAGCNSSKTEDTNSSAENQDSAVADNTDADNKSEEDDTSKLDIDALKGLSGQALYEAATKIAMANVGSQSYQMEMVSTDYSGQQVTTITTMVGDNYRIESQTAEGVSVYIYNDDEDVSYSYDEVTKQGYKMSESLEDYAEEFEDEFVEDDEFGNVKSAELGEFLGRPVLIAVFESTEEDGSFETEVWYDLEIGAALKTIMRQNGAVIHESVATNLDAKFKGNSKLFIPPDDIEIVEAYY